MPRTEHDKQKLRDKAEHMVAGRGDVELDDCETTGENNYPYKVGPDVCGAVIDKRSGKGKVVITSGGDSRVIQTDPQMPGDQFDEVKIADGETCMIYGTSTIIYIRPRRFQ